MSRIGWVAAIATATLALTSACTSESKQPTTSPAVADPNSSALPAVGLPDLSRMDPVVQEQMTTQYRVLSSRVENHSTPPRDLAKAYGDVGGLLLAAEYNEAAEPFYLHAEALAPDDVRWPYYLGHIYMATARLDQAIAAFERALRLSPNDVAALVWLGDIYLDQGKPELAEPRFTQALSIQPRMAAALFGLGRAALARRDYPHAVDMLEQLLAADPRASMAHYPLALAYRGLGDTARAEAHLRQQGGVEIGPPDPLMVELRDLLHGAVAEEDRGLRALGRGDFPAAAASFRKGLEAAPDNPSLRHKLGTALSLMGDTRGAMEQFQETVKRSPTFAQGYYSLGVMLASSGRYPDAIERFSTAVKYQPDYTEARLQLAETYRRVGQLQPSLAQYRQAIAIDPRSSDARFGYALTLVALQRYDEARSSLKEGATLFPDQPRFADALARLSSAPKGGR